MLLFFFASGCERESEPKLLSHCENALETENEKRKKLLFHVLFRSCIRCLLTGARFHVQVPRFVRFVRSYKLFIFNQVYLFLLQAQPCFYHGVAIRQSLDFSAVNISLPPSQCLLPHPPRFYSLSLTFFLHLSCLCSLIEILDAKMLGVWHHCIVSKGAIAILSQR